MRMNSAFSRREYHMQVMKFRGFILLVTLVFPGATHLLPNAWQGSPLVQALRLPQVCAEVCTVDPDGNLWGGIGSDQAWAIVVDSSGNTFITGQTTAADSPTSTGTIVIGGLKAGRNAP